MSLFKSTRLTFAFLLPLGILVLAAASHVQAAPELQTSAEMDSAFTRSDPLAFAVVRDTALLPASKRETIAALSVIKVAPQAENQAVPESTAVVRIALAPTEDRDAIFLPESKRETIAALSVPEIAPQVRQWVLPEFPVFARKARIQGTVYARVLIDPEGKVARVVRIEGQAVFHEAVRKAVQQWEFVPARQGSLSVRTWIMLPFSFEL